MLVGERIWQGPTRPPCAHGTVPFTPGARDGRLEGLDGPPPGTGGCDSVLNHPSDRLVARSERFVSITDAWPTALERRPAPEQGGPGGGGERDSHEGAPPPPTPGTLADGGRGRSAPSPARLGRDPFRGPPQQPRGRGGWEAGGEEESNAGTWARKSPRRCTYPVLCGGRGRHGPQPTRPGWGGGGGRAWCRWPPWISHAWVGPRCVAPVDPAEGEAGHAHPNTSADGEGGGTPPSPAAHPPPT